MGKRKIRFVVSAVIMLAVAALFAAKHKPEPYVDSWEAAQAMSEEEAIAIGQKILVCENGTLPQHAFAVMFRLQEIDPELAEACFRHIEAISVPAKKPDRPQGWLFRSNEPERFGAYVRDGNGGYYEYEEYEN